MSSEVESHDVETPSASPQVVPETPVPQKTALPHHTPTDSLVSVSLSEADAKSEGSIYSVETAPKDEESTYSLETALEDKESIHSLEITPKDEETTHSLETTSKDKESVHSLEITPKDEESIHSLETTPKDKESIHSIETTPKDRESTYSLEATPKDRTSTYSLEATPKDRASMYSLEATSNDKESTYSLETTPKDVVQEVIRRASCHTSPIEFMISDKVLDSPGADVRLVQELAMEKEKARSRSNSMVPSDEILKRARSESIGSDASLQVDWETLDKTEQSQEEESDEQTTLLLARLELENDAIAVDPKAGIKTRSRSQSRPPSIHQLHKLVNEQGARSVRFSLLPTAAPMTELDFWAALVRDYPQTALRLPTITSNKIRSGIPAPLRGVVWVSMAGARERVIEDSYDKLCGESSPYEKMIGKDIGRSFPQHEMFRDPEGEGQKMLGRVLKCYSLYDDKIGYCQGLGFLVGPLLMNMADKEAFCVLVRLMEDYDLRACFLPDLSGLHLRIYQFNRLLRQHVPKVSSHLENLGVEGEYLSQWFLSFFAVTCPLPLLFRIYDVVFAEGASETIMRVALSIMKRNEKKILGYADFDDVMQLLLSRQLWDVYGLSPASADEFVLDFVSFTSLVTRESLDALEESFREAQKNSGGRQSFLPSVSSAASRFLGRLWTSPKQQGLAPGNVPTNGNSRPNSTLLRTPSKQSLSTIGSIEATSDLSTSTASTASTAPTEVSTLSRDMSIESGGLRTVKSTDSAPSILRNQTQSSKEKELDGQIEDLLMMLSEMQKNQALLQSQLQKIQEDRTEDNVAIRAFIDQVKVDIADSSAKKSSHRRVASEVGQAMNSAAERPTISSTTVRLLHSLDKRLGSCHVRRISSLESKADLRASLASAREQLHVETTRSQELSRQLDGKDQESATLRDELQKARARIKDTHFDKQRLEKTVLELRHSQRNTSKSSIIEEDEPAFEIREAADASPSKSGGLRELRLGRSRTNSGAPTQIFSKRISSLAHVTTTASSNSTSEAVPIPSPASPRHATAISLPSVSLASTSAPPLHENDSLLLELANAKAAEAVAHQELEELRARFDSMRRMMTSVVVPAASPSPPVAQSPFSAPPLPPPRSNAASPAVAEGMTMTAASTSSSSATAASTTTARSASSASSLSSSAFGFFGWGKK